MYTESLLMCLRKGFPWVVKNVSLSLSDYYGLVDPVERSLSLT